MKAKIEPIIYKQKDVADLLGMSISKFTSNKTKEFLENKRFPKAISGLGYYKKDIIEWIERIDPNRSEINKGWDDVLEN